ncbi:hypothetical protein [Amycolatopsis minnesotensis]|uniref:Preprotein translocase subunit SecG n=1 Tax=Amycolatopsis minnesotensis TaxID=337894 RepID=A0ABP5CG92_9PSEU
MTFSLPAAVAVPVTAAATALAQQPNNPGGDKGGQGEDFGKSSPTGLLILILFLVAVAFLVRSMTKHLKRVPASFDKEEDAETAARAEGDSAEVAEVAADPEPEKPAKADDPDEAPSSSKPEKADHA